MISPPEFHYRGETLTLPAVNVSGDSVLNEDVTITRDRTIKRFPDPSSGFDNPIRESVVNVTVGSEFYRARGNYFEERTEGPYTGVIYAPVGAQGTGSVDVFGHLYGAVVTDDLTVGGTQGAGPGAGGTVHWDEALSDQRVVPPDEIIILLTFLHITENRISVTG